MAVDFLRARTLSAEIMDGEDYHEGEYERTLKEIEWINRFTNGYAPTVDAVKAAYELHSAANTDTPMRILDIGFGYGDTLRAIHRWAIASGAKIELHGVDLNPRAKKWAESATPPEFKIRYEVGDVFDQSNGRYDFMTNSLMMHHLSDQEIVRLLGWMTENSRIAWFINDLHRHPVAFHFARLLTRFAGFGRLVKNDAPLSVARSFTAAEWMAYLEQANIPSEAVRLRWHWAFRYGVFCRIEDVRIHR